ncbi:MAG: DUF2029 domain-containing protein [Bacteroidetes bacterium]|nr:DUF2029 domain-containing protein [Bacteroidota bacterium]
MKEKIIQFFTNYKIIFGIYILVAGFTAFSKFKRGPQAYNNYLLYKSVFTHTLEKKNIFALYPDLFFDCNHYGVFFSVLIAPFAIFPDAIGMILWNIANVLIFLFAIYKFPFSNIQKSLFAWLCLQEFITAALYFQFNIALTGLLMLSATMVLKGKEVQSALAIMIGTFVKIYGIVGLSAFLFMKNKIKFVLASLGLAILFFVLPMLLSDTHFGIQSYADWYISLSEKNIENGILGSRQDYSVMGVFRRVLNDATLPTLWFLVPGLVIFFLPYIRTKQYIFPAFQMMILASTLLFLVLFSSGSESPTYIIAVAGVMIWFLMQKKKSKLDIGLLIFVIVLTCFGFSDLFPKFVKENYIMKYSLKAVPCILVWLKINIELLTRNFEQDYKLSI